MSGDVEPWWPARPAEQAGSALRGRRLDDRSGGPGFTTPDFVIAGARLPDGRVRLIASDRVDTSDLSVGYDRAFVELDPVYIPVTTGYRITLTARLGHFTVVEAGSYPDALAELARIQATGR